MSQLSHDRLPFGQKFAFSSSLTPVVRTRGSHFQFTFYRFAISQFEFANYQTRQQASL